MLLRWKTAALFPFAAVAQRFLPAVMRRRAGKQQGCCRCSWFSSQRVYFTFSWLLFRLLSYVWSILVGCPLLVRSRSSTSFLLSHWGKPFHNFLKLIFLATLVNNVRFERLGVYKHEKHFAQLFFLKIMAGYRDNRQI